MLLAPCLSVCECLCVGGCLFGCLTQFPPLSGLGLIRLLCAAAGWWRRLKSGFKGAPSGKPPDSRAKISIQRKLEVPVSIQDSALF